MIEKNFLQILFPCAKCNKLTRKNIDGTYARHLCFEEGYKPKTKEWFLDRIGKRIYRDANTCPCSTCASILENGLMVSDENHADYLFHTDISFANESTFLNYRDVK